VLKSQCSKHKVTGLNGEGHYTELQKAKKDLKCTISSMSTAQTLITTRRQGEESPQLHEMARNYYEEFTK
jgi:hypothetical protein